MDSKPSPIIFRIFPATGHAVWNSWNIGMKATNIYIVAYNIGHRDVTTWPILRGTFNIGACDVTWWLILQVILVISASGDVTWHQIGFHCNSGRLMTSSLLDNIGSPLFSIVLPLPTSTAPWWRLQHCPIIASFFFCPLLLEKWPLTLLGSCVVVCATYWFFLLVMLHRWIILRACARAQN